MIDISQLVVAIDTHRDGAAVMIRPHIENPTPLTLRYRMAVLQRGSAGTSSVSQQGEIQTGATASLVRLSMPSDAECSVHLELFQDGVMIKTVDQSCDSAGT